MVNPVDSRCQGTVKSPADRERKACGRRRGCGRADKDTASMDIAQGLELLAELIAQDGLAHLPLPGIGCELLDSPD